MRRQWCMTVVTLALAGGSMLAAANPAAATTQHAAITSHSTATSHAAVTPAASAGGNWAGYAATGSSGAFTSVSSDWIQPTAHCTSTSQYAAFWVGLDGYSDSTVEQIGTEADCDGSTPVYYAWYELYPQDSVTFNNTVKAGDQFAASVTYAGSNKFTLKISDVTEGWSQAVTKTLASAERSSAEIITEASSGSGIVLPLSFFGKVSYTDALVNGAGLCKSDPTAVSTPGLTVSAITDCTNFTVTQTTTTP